MNVLHPDLSKGEPMPGKPLNPTLKQELGGLMRYMDRLRKEIAVIDKPSDKSHKLDSTGHQLNAIVKAMEEATNTIMNAVEKNEEVVSQLREQHTDSVSLPLLDKITAYNNAVFEACSFQDITGQRVNKVVKSITYVEERVNALVEICGKAFLAKVKVESDMDKTADEALLNGPQLNGEGLSQDDIDKLFD